MPITVSSRAIRDAGLLAIFDRALAEDRLELHFQPVLDTRQGGAAFVEALLRCPDYAGGYVPNRELIAALGGGERIFALGMRMVRQALAQLREWKAAGLCIPVSVNLTLEQLGQRDFAHWLLDQVEHHALSPDDLILEFAEDLPIPNGSRAARGIGRLALAGFTLALDDCGTAFYNLARLHALPLRLLKVHSEFAVRLNVHNGRRPIQVMAAICRAFDLELVVEGVDSPETVAVLGKLDVSLQQGCLHARPMDSQTCGEWLDGHRDAPRYVRRSGGAPGSSIPAWQ